MDMFSPLIRCMNSDRIAFVDGEDDTEICFVNGSLNFKRELTIPPNSKLFPISFAIPHEKLCTTSPIKVRLMSGQIPGSDRKYMFDTEAKYYEEYRQSKFAITTKKAGWDCKRHYEILTNKCIPVFQQISACPQWTMTTLPKRFLEEIERTFATATDATYDNWLAELTAWTHERCTTVKLAHYVLEKLCL